jgi:hypothetical protein
MKLILALAAAGMMSSLVVATPANAQKDPACMEKCNRANPEASRPGGAGSSGGGQAIRACIAACPRAKGAAKAK